MSQADKITVRIAELESDKELALLQDEFVAKKLAGKATPADRRVLYAARKEHRLHHRVKVPGASPAAIEGSITQGEVA